MKSLTIEVLKKEVTSLQKAHILMFNITIITEAVIDVKLL